MKEYYVCLSADVHNSSLCAYTDNEFIFNQYIHNTYPILQRLIGENYPLITLKFSTINDTDELFKTVKDEFGYKLTEDLEIISIVSQNNPENTLYMTYQMFSGDTELVMESCSIQDTFLQMLWGSVNWYNIVESIIYWPKPVKDMMELLYSKYMALIFALAYADTGAWINIEMRNMITKNVSAEYESNLAIYDVIDDAMMWVNYNDWTIDDDTEEGT